MATARIRTRLPLWRVTARHPKVGTVDLLVAARTEGEAVSIITDGVIVIRIRRQRTVRS